MPAVQLQLVRTDSAREVQAEFERSEARNRRIANALYDLQLTGVVGPTWCTQEGGGLKFKSLSPRQADELLRRFEAIARELPAATPIEADPGQLALFPAGTDFAGGR